MAKERLDKLVCAGGNRTRSEARRLIKIGQVSVNGIVVRSFGLQIDPQSDNLTVAGEVLRYEKYRYIMMNKPEGVICASQGKQEQTVVDLVPEALNRNDLFPAGRLDKDTTGFVLITDDGAFAHGILSPKRHVEKTYEAVLDKPITAEAVAAFRQGVVAGDGTLFQSARLCALNQEKTLVQVVICEGKYHQVKRMFAACGSHVQALRRTKIGGLCLDTGLRLGECRLICKEELDIITKSGNNRK